jgi:hypothetical protein
MRRTVATRAPLISSGSELIESEEARGRRGNRHVTDTVKDQPDPNAVKDQPDPKQTNGLNGSAAATAASASAWAGRAPAVSR